ncbi:hypothetical protein K435DRAFT_682405 [Dendrothele bispora CBS 962.96]|uniref:Transmembrane protein n=1 Tax=Dendrothele bispora (strain CBS 962.96) TaxID=1314807 RepID=A0A4S8LED8_DENBC|nr:hypothetical protein K435DRAFT_682405 [Dendrothele bispora CBS 962.96]
MRPADDDDTQTLVDKPRAAPSPLRTINGSVPIPKVFFLGLAILLSVVFVGTIMVTFRGAQAGPPFFKSILDDVAKTEPGIVLLGENVDIDVDEPSVGIRWSIVACGQDYVLPGSTGVHGSRVCGLPISPLLIFVDGDTEPTASYNPAGIPFDRKNGERRNIQNLVQFDSDHVLDVHNDYLYPFDTYRLSSTIRATNLANESVPIKKLATIEITSAFLVTTVDVESYSSGAPWQNQTETNDQSPSRDIDMFIRRPAESRCVALLLFTIGWFLTHICLGQVIMARGIVAVTPILKFLVVNGAILLTLPQLRNSMPDAPDLDGEPVDTIGFFSQMIIAGLCAVVLLLTVIARELDIGDRRPKPKPKRVPSNILIVDRRSSSKSRDRPPPTPTSVSSPKEVAEYEKHRFTRHLKGQYVFPPVEIVPTVEEEQPVTVHRRCKTAVMGV